MTWGAMVNLRRALTTLSLVILITLAVLFASLSVLMNRQAPISNTIPTPILGER